MGILKIPTSFKLFATTVLVDYDNKKLSNEGVYGECSYSDAKITLCDKYKDENLNISTIMDTFYHEKVHMILDAMGEHKLSHNEKFVEIFARLLRQSDETSNY